jgi:hypothetical protein
MIDSSGAAPVHYESCVSTSIHNYERTHLVIGTYYTIERPIRIPLDIIRQHLSLECAPIFPEGKIMLETELLSFESFNDLDKESRRFSRGESWVKDADDVGT